MQVEVLLNELALEDGFSSGKEFLRSIDLEYNDNLFVIEEIAKRYSVYNFRILFTISELLNLYVKDFQDMILDEKISKIYGCVSMMQKSNAINADNKSFYEVVEEYIKQNYK